MPSTVLVGAQWGDEGKGKICDLVAGDFDDVVSYSGGNNADNTIVDNGCTVIDVIVDHPIYGQLTGPLQISNRYEVSQFIERCKKAEPLSSLTDGIHLHTLSCPDEAAFERTKSALRALRVLLEENGN